LANDTIFHGALAISANRLSGFVVQNVEREPCSKFVADSRRFVAVLSTSFFELAQKFFECVNQLGSRRFCWEMSF